MLWSDFFMPNFASPNNGKNGQALDRRPVYLGVLRRDADGDVDDYLYRDPHYTFVEALPWTMKRNPCVFRGRLITVTRRDDGSLRLNFKPLRLNDGFTVDGYALEVAGEIREALKGLVGE